MNYPAKLGYPVMNVIDEKEVVVEPILVVGEKRGPKKVGPPPPCVAKVSVLSMMLRQQQGQTQTNA